MTKVNQALAPDLHRLQMIAHEVPLFALDLCLDRADAVLNVVEAETRLDTLLVVLVRQSVHEILIAHKEACAPLLKPPRLLACVCEVNHVKVGIVRHEDHTAFVLDSHHAVKTLANLNKGLVNLLLGTGRARDPDVAARLHQVTIDHVFFVVEEDLVDIEHIAVVNHYLGPILRREEEHEVRNIT